MDTLPSNESLSKLAHKGAQFRQQTRTDHLESQILTTPVGNVDPLEYITRHDGGGVFPPK